MRYLSLVLPLVLLYSEAFAQQARMEGSRKARQKLTFSWEGPYRTEAKETFLNFRMEVAFTDPTGQQMLVPGYFAADGRAGESSATAGNVWRAHLVPLVPGEWTYRVRFYRGDGLAIIPSVEKGQSPALQENSGTFRVLPADEAAAGFLGKGKLQYAGGPFLRFTDGDYFLKMGANSPEVFLEYADFDGTDSERSYSAHLKDWTEGDPVWQGGKGKAIIGIVNYLKEQGINAHYFLLMNAYGDGKKAYPWTGPDSFYEYDVSKLDQWQMVFDHMMEAGVMPQLVLSEQENQSYFETKEGGVFADSRKVYYREMAARFGYLQAVTWNIGEESGWEKEPTYGKAINGQQRKEFAAYLRELLPYEELIVVHNGPSNTDAIFEELLGHPAYTGISYQGNFENPLYGYERIRHWREASDRWGHPWVVSYDEPYTNPEFPDLDTWRKHSLWAALMGGAAGAALYVGKGRDLTIEDYRLYESYWKTMDRARRFFVDNHLPFNEMKPMESSEVGGGWGMSANSGDYLLYLPEGGKGRMKVPAGAYRLHWFDPAMGELYSTGLPRQVWHKGWMEAGNMTFKPQADWLLWLSRENGSGGEE